MPHTEIFEMISLINLHNDLWAIQKIWFETFLRFRCGGVVERREIELTFFMDLIANISTYSMPNWLCNDLTEMADQLKKKIAFVIFLDGVVGCNAKNY